jgi:hypothetical protein
MGGMNVPVRRYRATTVKREKSEPKKETGFGELPKGPIAEIDPNPAKPTTCTFAQLDVCFRGPARANSRWARR